MDLAAMREEYTRQGLSRDDLEENPFAQFEKWFQQSIEVNLFEPNAMVLATVSAQGQPTTRTVLLKYFDQKGLVFFTNYESRKAQQMAENPKVSLLFPWLQLERQVHITGQVEKVSTAESLKYFLSRPKGSQIGAWVSSQSSVISSRKLLMSKFEELQQKFQHKEVPLPSFWGGYRVSPDSFEFWQGGKFRLHDRFFYSLQPDGRWEISRLAP